MDDWRDEEGIGCDTFDEEILDDGSLRFSSFCFSSLLFSLSMWSAYLIGVEVRPVGSCSWIISSGKSKLSGILKPVPPKNTLWSSLASELDVFRDSLWKSSWMMSWQLLTGRGSSRTASSGKKTSFVEFGSSVSTFSMAFAFWVLTYSEQHGLWKDNLDFLSKVTLHPLHGNDTGPGIIDNLNHFYNIMR